MIEVKWLKDNRQLLLLPIADEKEQPVAMVKFLLLKVKHKNAIKQHINNISNI